MNRAPTADLRFEALVESLRRQQRSAAEFARWSHLVVVLSGALPAEEVGRARRVAGIAA